MCSKGYETAPDACREMDAPSALGGGDLERLRATMDLLPVGMFLIEGESLETAVVRGANAAFVEMAGRPVPAGPLQQVLPDEVYAPDGKDPLPPSEIPALQAMAAGRTTRDAEYRIRWPDGEWRNVLVSATPVRTDGRITGGVVVVQDITARVSMEEALRRSEGRFRLALTGSPVTLCTQDRALRYTWVYNPHPAGPDAEGTIGKTDAELIGPDAAEPLERLKAGVLHTGEATRGEVAVCLGGETVVFDARIEPLRDGRGEIIGVTCAITDISERKRAEERNRFLSQAGEILAGSLDYRATLDRVARLAVPVVADWCLVLLLGDGGVGEVTSTAHVDPEAERVAQETASRHAADIESREPYATVLQTGRSFIAPEVTDEVLERLGIHPDRLAACRQLGLRSAMIVALVARGRVLGAMSFGSTTSGRRYGPEDLALAEELARRAALAVDNALLYREAQEANAAKDQFMAMVSHELRNPMSAIQTGVYAIRQRLPKEDRVQRTLEIVDRNVKLQARLINDLLDLSRIARGKLHLQRAPTALDRVALAAFEAYRAEAEAVGLVLETDLQPDVWVQGDFDRLQQLVMNLLSNAIKFTPPPGRVTVRVEGSGEAHCGLRRASGQSAICNLQSEMGFPEPSIARIVVEDTGVGISAELLPDLFDLFQQGEVAGRRAAGLGLGLSLVRSIAEMHGGRARAESEGIGKGSRFLVELPRIPRPDIPRAERRAVSPSQVKVLLVEDNPGTRALIEESLSLAGYEVHAAASGEEGLEVLGEVRPDAMLVDIGLPGIDGCEFLRRARELPGMRDVPAFAVTGYGQEEDVRRGREAGFAAHFVKPVDIAALDQRIREWAAVKE